MRILINGGHGLLAHSLRELATADLEVECLDLPDFDLTRPETMIRHLDAVRPEVVINTAAYNLVDRCEQERDLSWAVNAEGPKTLAQLCGERGCRMVHYSSDYVFDGAKASPYTEADIPNPLNHYGAGKLAGEQAVLTAAPANLVLRTSWLFGPHPTQTKTYLHTVMRLTATGSALKATTDQVAVPTYSPDLASWTLELIRLKASGLFHAVNDDGVSRYDWTLAILADARQLGLLSAPPSVEAVTTAYFTPTMRRPGYTVLGNSKLTDILGRPCGSWRPGVRKMLATGWPR
jgi:dTDP-4-dehydrorhamnose reductase